MRTHGATAAAIMLLLIDLMRCMVPAYGNDLGLLQQIEQLRGANAELRNNVAALRDTCSPVHDNKYIDRTTVERPQHAAEALSAPAINAYEAHPQHEHPLFGPKFQFAMEQVRKDRRRRLAEDVSNTTEELPSQLAPTPQCLNVAEEFYTDYIGDKFCGQTMATFEGMDMMCHHHFCTRAFHARPSVDSSAHLSALAPES